MNPPDLPPNNPAPPALPERRRFNAWIFVALLLAPPLLTALVASIGDRKGDLAPGVAVFGGGLAGIIAGVMLGRRVGKETPVRIVLSVVFAVVFAAVCVVMSCFGCLAGGYQFLH